jgi:hypothetical protein
MLAFDSVRGNANATVHFTGLIVATAQDVLSKGFVSGIGHPATRQMAADLLGVEIPEVNPADRVKVAMQPGDSAVVVQYIGPRLAEGEIMHNPNPDHFTLLFVEVEEWQG